MSAPKKYITTSDGAGGTKRLSAATSVGPTRSKMDGPLDYAAIGVGGNLPPIKNLKQINAANKPGGRSGAQEGVAQRPYMDAQRAQFEVFIQKTAQKRSGPGPQD